MDFLEATQVLHDETTNNCEDEPEVAVLKIGGESHAIRKGINRIGRSPLCRVILNDAAVSKVHAEIQAGVEQSFISDLRSSNGTKIKDVLIKPFYHYTINDGDVIYFGQVRAEYRTIKTTSADKFSIPDTPATPKNRNGSDKCNTGIANISESFINDSTINQSDTSMIPGTQETFQKPSTPIARKEIPSTKSLENLCLGDVTTDTDIHDMETQQNLEVSFQPPARKRLRLESSHHSENEINIHEAETQVIQTSIPKRKEAERPQISNEKASKERENEDDIFAAETQVLPATISDKKSQNSDIFEAETQAMPIPISNKKYPKKFKIQVNIFDAETQLMETPKPQDDIFDAETQLTMSISQERNIVKSENREIQIIQETKVNKNHENIFEMATQIVPVNKDKILIAGSSNDRFNETAESSIRSNSSRDRLRLSSTPPSSPENDIDEIAESQNLLEIAETPLLNYEKIEASKNLSSVNKEVENEEKTNVGERSANRRKVQTIPDSSESETDDERDFTKFVRKSKPSNVIEDSSDEPTDEENEFGDLFPVGRGKREEILAKNIRGTPTKGRLEVKKDSPLRLRRKEEDSGTDKAGVSITVSSSDFLQKGLSNLTKRTEESSPEKMIESNKDANSSPSESLSKRVEKSLNEETWTNDLVEISKNLTRENPPLTAEEKARIVKSKFGASPLRLPRKKDGVSPTKNQNEGAASNLFEDSKEDREATKIQSRPSLSLRLPRKVDLERKSDEKLSKEQEKSNDFEKKQERSLNDEEEENIFGAATQKMNTKASSNLETVEKNEQREDDDIDLLPTQILHIASSTPFSNKSRRKVRPQFEGDDLHCAPTQIMNESSENEIVDVEVDNEKKKVEEKQKDEASKMDLDDSLAINLGNLLGEEANEDRFNDNDSSMMMTQNLVDILKPTQTYVETETRKQSPRTSGKKIYASGTLGFIDGEAKDSKRELVSADSSPDKAVREEKEAEPDKPRKPAMLEDDDIFAGLPEVSIWGTLSNPGSPTASSTTSSHNDFVEPVKLKSKQERKTWNSASTSKSIVSLDKDSPIVTKKSRLTRQDSARLKASEINDDSDDDLNYQDLKRMADRLLATNTPKDDKRKENIIDVEKIPVPLRKPNVRKAVTKKTTVSERRAVKLSSASSSLIVSDSKSESAESSGESRKSSRKRKSASSDCSTSGPVAAKQPRGEESQEVELILSSVSDENHPMMSRKTYATIQKAAKKVDDEEEKISNVTERPKVTRQRRTITTLKKEISSPVASPRSRARRTIGDGPGITGNNGRDHKVLFTGVKDDEYCKIVTKLGGTVVEIPSKATVLITDKVRRTYKFLCAVAQGISVVSINWLIESKKASRFLDCDNYILKEPEAEAKYKFTLEKSLRIARTKKLLEGYTIIVTPKVVQPEVHELKGMIEACGGKLLARPGRNWDAKTVIISREEDFTVAKSYLAKAPKNLKISIQSTEFILTGILRQEINLVDHKLDFQ